MKRKNTAAADPRDADDRVLRSKKAVLAATFQLLGEQGLAGVSVDEVAKRSGVAKTTIYRHWPSRSALLIEACSSMGTRPQVPDTGGFRGDLTALAIHMAARLRADRWASILPSVIDAAERDPEIATVHTRLHAGFMAPLYAVIERAQAKGELPKALDPSEIVASVVGPLFYRRWFSRQPLDEQFVSNIVEAVVVSRMPRRTR
jgi:AcrR family transcriptional regulator